MRQGQPGVLLHEYHGQALLPQALDGGEDLPDHERRQAKGGLVEQKKLGARHEGAADGQHLLLPPGERSGGGPSALGQDRKKAVNRGQVGF